MLKKDIFINNNIAKNFSNPLDPEYKKLIKWLMEFSSNPQNHHNNAYLVVSKKLLAEYYRTMGHAASGNNIAVIINLLNQQGRLIQISNDQIKEFKQKHFIRKIEKCLVSNKEDREHIPVVLLSERRYALTLDEKFTTDLIGFPSFIVTVGKKPTDTPYDK